MTGFKSLLVSLAMLALAAAIGIRVMTFEPRVVASNHAWIDRATVKAQNRMTAKLFRSAVRHGYIRFDTADNRIVLLTPREIDAGQAEPLEDLPAGFGDTFGAAETRKLLARTRGAGPEIGKEIARHQSNRGLLGVRDAGLTSRCATVDDAACSGRPWTIALAGLAETGGAPGLGTDTAFPEPGMFRGLVRPLPPYSGTWTVLPGLNADGRRFRLRPVRARAGATGQVVVDLVGAAPELAPELQPSVRHTAFCLPDGVEIQTLRIAPCADLKQDDTAAVAHQFAFPASAWQPGSWIEAGPVELPALPAGLSRAIARGELPRLLDDLALAPESGLLERTLDDRFELRCNRAACWPHLRDSEGSRRVARDLVADAREKEQILSQTATDVSIADPEGPEDDDLPVFVDNAFLRTTPSGALELTELARALHLQPALGVPGLENGSLLNFLGRLPEGVTAGEIELTFDATIQRTALTVLRGFLQDRAVPSGTAIRAEALQQHVARLPGARDAERRAGFVLIDLRDQPGAVRAAVRYPLFDPNLPIWDLQALATGTESASPATPTFWRGLDGRTQPGSSMKIISALSQIRSALGMNAGVPEDRHDAIRQAVLGADPGSYPSRMGFRVDQAQTTLSPQPGYNAPDFTFADRGEVPLQYNDGVRQACRSRGVAAELAFAGRNYGVCEAMARSSNIFFGRMAVYENPQAIAALIDAEADPRPFTALAQTLDALGLVRPAPLVLLPPDVATEASFAPRAERPSLVSAPDLGKRPAPQARNAFHAQTVAIDAYGQGAQMAPLAMATAAGAVALNAVVTPHIARAEGAEARPGPPLVPDTTVAGAMLDELRLGMRAVVSPGGTGYASFNAISPNAASILPRVSGKTGTATQDDRQSGTTFYTHWFVGWVSDDAAHPRFAFACAVSHTTGGLVCPALTGAILGELDAVGALQ